MSPKATLAMLALALCACQPLPPHMAPGPLMRAATACEAIRDSLGSELHETPLSVDGRHATCVLEAPPHDEWCSDERGEMVELATGRYCLVRVDI